MVGRVLLAAVLGLVLAAPAGADDVALDWSVADRLNGRTGIDLAAPARKAPLRITVGGSCHIAALLHRRRRAGRRHASPGVQLRPAAGDAGDA